MNILGTITSHPRGENITVQRKRSKKAIIVHLLGANKLIQFQEIVLIGLCIHARFVAVSAMTLVTKATELLPSSYFLYAACSMYWIAYNNNIVNSA